ncbi:cytochrome P450 [Parahaliea maris]|uniref:Cytochrome P450 n=1 Tax=Parahaliea maris TaxID=2716870 RepID=A0A5C9A8V4_9GAMM|nr:cytochrome P450 [Parahaliea maris]TXS96120.1 cytochrome P450 [Parahaliea maris]
MSQCPFSNLMDPKFLSSGYDAAAVAAIREAGPAVRIEDPLTGVPYWAVTRHAAIDFVSKNNNLFSSRLRAAVPMEFDQEMVDNIQSRMFLNLDPPENLEYRKLIRDHFSPAAVAGYEPRARQYASEIVDRVIDRGECEFVTDIAAELPLLMILDFFDIPAEDRKDFFEWTNLMMFADDPDSQVSEDAGMQAAANIMMYAHELAAKWRGSNERNVSSQLLNGEINGEPVSDETFAWIVLMILSAGNESTRTTITHGMRNLIANPEQYRYLQEHPDKLDDAILEIVRYNPPFVCMRRTATQDITAPELGNAPIKKGDKVIMYYPGANRDEAIFAQDPEAFDIHRSDYQDMVRDIRSFGIGRHNCFGMNLAKMEMQVMLGEILRRIDNPRLSGDVLYMHSNFIQGIKAMPITFDKRT